MYKKGIKKTMKINATNAKRMKESLGELEMKMLKNEIKTLGKIARKRIIEIEK